MSDSVPFIDRMLTAEEAAQWLGMTKRSLLAKSKGRWSSIPAVWLNARTVRFHPRTIIAKRAQDSGARPEFVSAMFGERRDRTT